MNEFLEVMGGAIAIAFIGAASAGMVILTIYFFERD